MVAFQIITLSFFLVMGACGPKVEQSDVDPTQISTKPEPKKHFSGPGFDIILESSWQKIDLERAFGDRHAIVVLAGPDGCLAAVLRYTYPPTSPKQNLVIARQRHIADREKRPSLRVSHQNPVRYNDTTAHRYRLVDHTSESPLDLQGTILSENAQITELLVWSSSSGRLARRCHDHVTARFDWLPENPKKPEPSNGTDKGS
jgi:hypothetical protein